jgi:A/G-specific adenine glycosylase
LQWYRENGRDLPWRHTRDPYAILVSEFMLQQTQVAAVIPYYRKWLFRFPDFQSLAAAPEMEVLHAWQGLGYYSRARNLHATAKIISADFEGQCPQTAAELVALPGIGRYTAHAILTFAFNRPVAIVEANIGRLFARLFNISAPLASTEGRNAVWNHAAALVPARAAGAFNSALMDLGATVCVARLPKCGFCPVKKSCRSTDPLNRPVTQPRPKRKRLSERHAFTLKRKRILLQQCHQRWRGMWMLPTISSPEYKLPLHVSKFPFTHHEVTLQVFANRPGRIETPAQRWFPLRQLDSIPIPSPHRRAIDALLSLAKN